MQIIKLNATDSTNLYLKNLMSNVSLEDYTIVVANQQTKGRGQMGAVWESEEGKNLTFSVLKRLENLTIQQQFVLNIATSMAVYSTLSALQIPDLKIKWPDDILSGNNKICGILIENVLSGSKIQVSVIGIGLNVNQMVFNNLPNVSSLKLLTGANYNLDELLNNVIQNLRLVFDQLLSGDEHLIKKNYLDILFRKDKASTFRNEANQMFTGIIRGVSVEGKLIVEEEDNILKEYGLKEIKLLY